MFRGVSYHDDFSNFLQFSSETSGQHKNQNMNKNPRVSGVEFCGNFDNILIENFSTVVSGLLNPCVYRLEHVLRSLRFLRSFPLRAGGNDKFEAQY